MSVISFEVIAKVPGLCVSQSVLSASHKRQLRQAKGVGLAIMGDHKNEHDQVRDCMFQFSLCALLSKGLTIAMARDWHHNRGDLLATLTASRHSTIP